MKKMTHIKLWTLLLSFTFFLTYPASHTQAVEATSVKVTDMVGREVVLEEGPAKEIVALMPADAEILFELGVGDRLIGRGAYVDYPAEEVEDIPAIATGQDLNVEEIIKLSPDLVIMSTMTLTPDQLEAVEVADIPVIITDAKTLEEVYTAIELIGQVTASEDKANQLVEEMQATFQEFQAKVEDINEEKTVYYEISPLEFGLWTAGSQTFMDEIGQMLKLENIFVDQEGFVEVSEEQVLLANPAYIITTSVPMDPKAVQADQEILDRENWQEVAAVQDQQVFAVDNSAFTRPGPRLMDAIKELYQIVYE